MKDIIEKKDNDPTSEGELTADDYNQLLNETKNVVKNAGLSLNENDKHQLSQASWKIGNSHFWVDNGSTANVIKLQQEGISNLIGVLNNGLILTFKAKHTNTGNVQIGVLGQTKSLVNEDGTKIATGGISQNHIYSVRYDKNLNKFILLGHHSIADSNLNQNSINPVQNKTIVKGLENVRIVNDTSSTTNHTLQPYYKYTLDITTSGTTKDTLEIANGSLDGQWIELYFNEWSTSVDWEFSSTTRFNLSTGGALAKDSYQYKRIKLVWDNSQTTWLKEEVKFISVDNALSSSSQNPVENKAIKTELDKKVENPFNSDLEIKKDKPNIIYNNTSKNKKWETGYTGNDDNFYIKYDGNIYYEFSKNGKGFLFQKEGKTARARYRTGSGNNIKDYYQPVILNVGLVSNSGSISQLTGRYWAVSWSTSNKEWKVTHNLGGSKKYFVFLGSEGTTNTNYISFQGSSSNYTFFSVRAFLGGDGYNNRYKQGFSFLVVGDQ